jgi:hypothetical protein
LKKEVEKKERERLLEEDREKEEQRQMNPTSLRGRVAVVSWGGGYLL